MHCLHLLGSGSSSTECLACTCSCMPFACGSKLLLLTGGPPLCQRFRPLCLSPPSGATPSRRLPRRTAILEEVGTTASCSVGQLVSMQRAVCPGTCPRRASQAGNALHAAWLPDPVRGVNHPLSNSSSLPGLKFPCVRWLLVFDCHSPTTLALPVWLPLRPSSGPFLTSIDEAKPKPFCLVKSVLRHSIKAAEQKQI